MSIQNDLFSFLKNVEKSHTIEEQFLSDLDKVIQLSKKQHKPSKSIKPSSLGGCFREQWFMLIGEEPDPSKNDSANNITITESGSDRHSRLQNHIASAQLYGVPIEWIDPEEQVQKVQKTSLNTIVKRRDGNEVLCWSEDYQTSFKCDGIIRYRGITMILEIKTEDHFNWIQRFSPEPKHEFQAALYSLCLGIDHVMFLYENRNYTNRKAFKVTITDEFKAQVKQRIEYILLYKETNKVPPKEKTKCTYCRYKGACKAIGESKFYTIEELKELIA